MIDTLDKKYGGEASGATTSTGVSEKTRVTPAKDEELTGVKKKVTKKNQRGLQQPNRQHILKKRI